MTSTLMRIFTSSSSFILNKKVNKIKFTYITLHMSNDTDEGNFLLFDTLGD